LAIFLILKGNFPVISGNMLYATSLHISYFYTSFLWENKNAIANWGWFDLGTEKLNLETGENGAGEEIIH